MNLSYIYIMMAFVAENYGTATSIQKKKKKYTYTQIGNILCISAKKIMFRMLKLPQHRDKRGKKMNI